MKHPEFADVFNPTEAYLSNVNQALRDLFKGVPVRLVDDSRIRERAWQDRNYLFRARESKITMPRKLFGLIPFGTIELPRVVYMDRFRTNLSEDGLVEERTYCYYGNQSSPLQVINKVFDPNTTVDTAHRAIREEAEAEFGEMLDGVHSASAIDYMDFLAEISSYSVDKEIEF